jgi:hypothetical protein
MVLEIRKRREGREGGRIDVSLNFHQYGTD